MKLSNLYLAAFCAALFSGASLSAQTMDLHENNSGGPIIMYNQAALGTARDFGPQDINAGGTSPALTIYIGNTGASNLVLSLPVIQGTNPNDFQRDAMGFSNNVAPGAYTSFTVWFDPQSIGIKTAQVTFTQNDPAHNPPIANPTENPFHFELRGQGTDNGGVNIDPTHTPPPGRVDTDYQVFAFAVSGGIPPYTWALNSGTLPPGVTLSPNGGLGGTVSGNPGQYNFTVSVQDNFNRLDIESFSIVITDPQSGTPPQSNTFGNSSTTCSATETGAVTSLLVLALLAAAVAIRKRRLT